MSYTPSETFDRTAFGELRVAEVTPIAQASAQYNVLTSRMRAITSGTGSSAGASGGEFTCSSGTTAAGFGTVFSKIAANYHAGQGLVGKFTARFGTPQASHAMYAGLLNATDAFAFGYQNTTFGIFHRHHGQQEIQNLNVTGAAGGSENATVTIDGTGYTVPLTAGTVNHNAAEIATSLNSQVPLWTFEQIGDDVVCRSLLSEVVAGAFTFSSSTATAVFSQTAAGAAVTEDFVAQTSWNMNTYPTLDTTKGNVFGIQMQYLGYGDIFFGIEDPDTGRFSPVHILKKPNSITQPTVANPSFRVGWVTGNRGATTSATISGASCALELEGKHIIAEQARSSSNTRTGVSTTETNILTIQNRNVYGTLINVANIVPEFMSIATDSSKGAIFRLSKGSVPTGQFDFDYIDSSESIALLDTSNIAVTNGANIATVVLGPSGSEQIELKDYNISLLPGETLTISAEVTSGAASDMIASLVWQEDI